MTKWSATSDLLVQAGPDDDAATNGTIDATIPVIDTLAVERVSTDDLTEMRAAMQGVAEAQRALIAAEAVRDYVFARQRERYGMHPADTIGADGAITRAGNA